MAGAEEWSHLAGCRTGATSPFSFGACRTAVTRLSVRYPQGDSTFSLRHQEEVRLLHLLLTLNVALILQRVATGCTLIRKLGRPSTSGSRFRCS